MPSWTSDLCGCKSIFYMNNETETIGELISPCPYHSNFNDCLNDNKYKNTIINNISEIIDMTDKEIYATIDNEGININLINFSENDLENVYALNYTNVNYNIIESN